MKNSLTARIHRMLPGRLSCPGSYSVLAAMIAFLGMAGFMKGTPAAADAPKFQMLDMKPIVNMDWQDEKEGDGRGGWTDQGDTDMRGIQVGTRTFFGIPFEVIDPEKNNHKAVLTLKSKKFHAGPLSAAVDAGAKARSIYFLHASAWTGGQMASYFVNYDDGTSVEIPIKAGEEITDWWGASNGPKYRVAFLMPNLKTDAVGLVIFGWDNPNPDKVIKNIEFRSQYVDGIVLVAAVTFSDQPVNLPDAKDIPTPDYLKSDLDVMDMAQWFPVGTQTDKFDPTPIDVSATLDGPAGKHGFMYNKDGRFVFEDGTPVHLVATMIGTPTDKASSKYLARWLAKYGFNMVRIGHLVTGPEGGSAVDWSKPDSGHLNPAVMDNLDYFISECAKNGVYSRLTMLWYRKMKKGDNAPYYDEIVTDQAKDNLKKQNITDKSPNFDALLAAQKDKETLNSAGITFVNDKVQDINIDLEKAIMTHKNPYRDNKMYGEDPVICQIEVTNEDGIFFYTIDGIPKPYMQELDNLWGQWLLKKYGSRDALVKAWADAGGALGDSEDPAKANVKRLPIWQLDNISAVKAPRAGDQMNFYSDLNNRYFTRTKDALRAAGVKQAICGSGWIGNGIGFWADIYSNVPNMDYTDRHHYYGGGPGGWQILPSLEFNTECALTKPECILKLSQERVLSMPYTISEWANVLPNQWRVEAPGLMAFYGNCLNAWDAPIHFAMAGGGFTNFLKWMWPVNEASTLCQYPILSQVIRRGDVKEGKLVYARSLTPSKLFSGKAMPDAAVLFGISGPYEMTAAKGVNLHSLAAMYAAGVGKTGLQLAKDDTPDYSIDMSKYLDMKKKEIRSITGELYWNYETGYVTANTPRIQAAIGFLKGVAVKLKDCEISTDNLVSAILVSSWDGAALNKSKQILIAAVGRTRNTDMAYTRGGQRLLTIGKEPVLLEGVKGSVTLKHSGKCTVTALSPYGYKTVDVTPTFGRNSVTIPMTGLNKAVYYYVTFE